MTGTMREKPTKWPKVILPLTLEQEAISNDFMHYWHEVLPRRYGIVDEFNHNYVVRTAPKSFIRTLEIGAGNGEHLKYETLNVEQITNYYALDIRANMLAALSRKYSEIKIILGDCQGRLAFEDGYFHRIIAVHVLEHLPNLPAAVKEIYRLCDKSNGLLSIVIPCEGSLAYSLARRISARRLFERRYRQSYGWFIEREHLNRPGEIFHELVPYFTLRHSTYFPFPLKVTFCNLCIGATFTPKDSLLKDFNKP